MGVLFLLSVAAVIVAVDLVAAAIYLVAADDPAASFASVPRQLLAGCRWRTIAEAMAASSRAESALEDEGAETDTDVGGRLGLLAPAGGR